MASKDCYENSSEEIRVNCSVCIEENNDVSAEIYCVECNDYYCTSCVTIHTTVPALRSHKLLDKDAGQDGKLPLVPTERCEKHMFKPVDMFCENHDEIGCYTCMAANHRICQDVFYIPDLMKTRASDVTCFLQCFTDVEEKLQKFQERFLGWRDSLRKSKEQELGKISDFKANLAIKIKEEEQRALQMVETCFEGLDKDLQTNVESVSKELESIEKTKRLIKLSSQNSSFAFVIMKMNQETLKNAESAFETVSKVKINHGIKFAPSRTFETILTDQLCLGNVTQEDSFISKFTSKGNIDIKSDLVSLSNDTLGSCVLHDGDVVLADHRRKRLQRIDSNTLSVSDEYSLNTPPWGVCCLNEQEIAACLPSEKRIQMFSTEGQFTPSRSITVEFGCRAVSYIKNKFYLSDKSCLFLCSEEGIVLKTFRNDSTGKALFSDIFSICVSNDAKLLYVCDSQKGVITLGDDGNVVNVVSTEIRYPNGVTTDDVGNIFVCGFKSKNLIQLDILGTFYSTIIENRSDVPQAICFDSKLHRL